MFETERSVLKNVIERIATVVGWDVPKLTYDQGTTLTAILERAIEALDSDNTVEVCYQLQAFINLMNVLMMGGGRAKDEAIVFHSVIRRIENELGC